MKLKNFSFALAAITALMLVNSSCKKSSDPIVEPPVLVTGLQLSSNAKFGNILTDNKGMSVYFFSRDVGTTSNCNDGCAVTWPPFYKENPTIGTGLVAADFGVITRTDGSKQTTYKGWPLYYYMNDKVAGDTNGDAVGNLWAIAKADYTVMFANAQLVGHDGVSYNAAGTAGTGSSQYITDPMGRTLYYFSRDTKNTNTFTRADLSNNGVWPLFEVSSTMGSIPSIFDKTQFTTITVAGKTQLVYKGRPLYLFGQDALTKGNTKGVSFPTAGAAIWGVVNLNTTAL